jgi:transcriptional regulator with XRE-family HTH domain
MIGELIRAERIRRGMSQVALAGLCGHDEHWVVDLEKERVNPRLRDVQRLCSALRISVGIETEGSLYVLGNLYVAQNSSGPGAPPTRSPNRAAST